MAKILIVDDEPDILDLFARMLSAHDCTLCGSAADAIATVADGAAYDLSLIDYNMPAVNGLQLAEAMADTCTPFMIITADTSPVVEADAMAAGALAVMHKPVRAAALREAVADGLSKKTNADCDVQRRRIVDIAVGVLLTLRNCDDHAAYAALRNMARNTRQPIVSVARRLVHHQIAINQFATG